MSRPLPSIQRRILSSIFVVLLALTLLMTTSFGYLNYRRVQENLVERMNIGIEVAWQDYQERPRQLISTLQSLSSLSSFKEAAAARDAASLQGLLFSLAQADFTAVVGPDGHVIAHTNAEQVGLLAPFPQLVSDTIRRDTLQFSTEAVLSDWVAAQMPGELARVYVPAGCNPKDPTCLNRGLVQVVIVPVDLGRYQKGALVSGILLNNTSDIPSRSSTRLRGSYLSISSEGYRVAANISTDAGPVPTGGQQNSQLVKTILLGQRYYGTVPLNSENHFVVSDPIFDAAGQVIGALSLGLPPSGFSQLQQETQALILGAAGVALVVAFLFAMLLARQLAQPIFILERNVIRLSQAHGSDELQKVADQIRESSPNLYSHEVMTLYQSLGAMAQSLADLSRESDTYLKRVEQDRLELQALTAQLREAKSMLEKKVEERTQELEQVVSELREANSQKSQFLATMSHELRTPLNSVIGFSEMMADELVGPLTPMQQEYLDHILSSGRHLLQLISDILDLSRIEQGRLSLDLQPVLLPELIDSLLAKVSHQAGIVGLNLEVNINGPIPPVEADPTRIKEVLYNLLSNAIKFTPEGGKIWVGAYTEGEHAVVEVEDTGIGMRPEDQAVVFNEFVQAESAYHRRFEGAGLGLPLSKKLVELHGGSIELKSQLGKGTLVRFYLPIQQPEKGGVTRG